MQTETSYLGFRLPHPFIAGASPFGHRLDTVRRLEDAGCAAVVLHSLFEEQITPPATFPAPEDYPLGPDAYAEHLSRVKRAVRIPVIGSLNGTSPESWLRFARVIEQAGADALELNLYEVVTDLHTFAAAVERQFAGIVREVKRILTIPVAVKVSPFFTAFGNMASRLDTAGVDGIVMFNRFYQPDIDTRTMTASPTLELSRSSELLLRLRWLAILHGRVRASLAVTGGVERWNDGVKAILAGASAVQMVSALLRHGPTFLTTMLEKLVEWMEWYKVPSVEEMRGRVSLKTASHPEDFERANYIRALHRWTQ